MTTPVELVLSRLPDAKKTADGWMARCPAHEDRVASLAIGEGKDGRALVKCMAGCHTPDVVAAVGLTMADLAPPDGQSSAAERRILATYDYTDEAGDVLFQVVRFAPKDFRQRRPDGNGGWIWSLDKDADKKPLPKPTRRVLYRLPKVFAAARAGGLVFVVEGEKDVHSLEQLGLTATCNPHGAGKWRDAYSLSLKGARVAILPDNDEPGRVHARAVLASLTDHGIPCAIIEIPMLPAGGDASDGIAIGADKEYLEALADMVLGALAESASNQALTRSMFIDWATFWDRDYTEAEWVFPNVLARSRGHALYAAHKTGKSLLMLWVAAQLATGSEPVVVVYLDYEMTEADIFDRLEDMGYGRESDFSRLRYALLPTLPALDTSAGAEALTQLVNGVADDWPEHHIVTIIDTIGRAVEGEENDADTFRDFYNHTGIELKRRGITWMRLDHGGKDLSRGQRGSSSKGDDVDVVWKLTPTEGGVCLHRDFSRMPWVPANVTFGLSEEPLAYKQQAGDWPAGTGEIANLLNRLGVPLDASSRTAAAALKAVGEGRRREVLIAAQRWRKERFGGPS